MSDTIVVIILNSRTLQHHLVLNKMRWEMGECASQFELHQVNKRIFDSLDESYELGNQYITTYVFK